MAKATNTNGNGHTMGEAPKGWKKIEMNRLMYNSDRGKGGVIQGDMLGILDMPPANGKEWQALVVRLTAPCGSCVDREKKATRAEVGQEILVPLTHQMRQHLARAAVHPGAIFEVWIKPTGSVKTNAGQMVTYDMNVNPQPKRREATDRMLAMQAAAPALPPAGASGQGADASDDIPF